MVSFLNKLPNILGKLRSSSGIKTQVAYWIQKCGAKKPWMVVQIGANDGKTKDPLHQAISKNPKWDVLFVEPVPYLFEKLKAHYPETSRFRFENSAINEGSVQDFYWVDKKAKYILGNIPEWYDQLGSFDKNHIRKHLNGILEPFIVSKKIQGITLEALFQKHHIQQIDLLRIDCEGYDWKILRQLDLSRFKPSLLLIEIKHLNKEELKSTISFLSHDYHIYQLEGDFMCIAKGTHEQLSKNDRYHLSSRHSFQPLKNQIMSHQK
ncbi:FkbM family methyltransferase [Aquiflexum sp.]|uniref:FkbM family methyltransferase n=1 Tax=Aquiflexum sp. TaxID=1872584 RepID=UPI003592FF9C